MIIPFSEKWNGSLSYRNSTKYIVLHHASAKNYSFKQCHQGHLNQGWTGIGYHFYVTKDGTVYEGRPINAVGAQVSNYNSISLGICAEGNYDTESSMPEKQLRSIAELLEHVKNIYPSAQIVGHKELGATACPGRYYPLDKLKDYKSLLGASQDMEQLKILENEIQVLKNEIASLKSLIPKVYKTYEDIPEWYKDDIKKWIDKGLIKGTGEGELNISEDICRMIVYLERGGIMNSYF